MNGIEVNIIVDGIVTAYVGMDGRVCGDITLARFVADHESQPEDRFVGPIAIQLVLRDAASSPERPSQSPEMLLFEGESNAADRWRVASQACRLCLPRPLDAR